MAKDDKGHGSNTKGWGHEQHWAASQSAMKEAAEHAKAGRGKEAADARVKARDHADEANYLKRKGSGAHASSGSNGPKYNAGSVDKAIDSAYRGQKGPTGSQRAVTHALLKGRESPVRATTQNKKY